VSGGSVLEKGSRSLGQWSGLGKMMYWISWKDTMKPLDGVSGGTVFLPIKSITNK
jgi:hypothetical protein